MMLRKVDQSLYGSEREVVKQNSLILTIADAVLPELLLDKSWH